jgi:outer membrane protein OmpA-like peptidoglycan-associated protein
MEGSGMGSGAIEVTQEPSTQEGSGEALPIPEVPIPSEGTGQTCTVTADCPLGEVCREGCCRPECQDRALGMVYFDFDGDLIRQDQTWVLDQAAVCLEAWREDRIRIEGHNDERNSDEENLLLTERRARAVRNYLQSLGVDGARLDIIAYGESRPICTGHDETCWRRNRRAELHWISGPAGEEVTPPDTDEVTPPAPQSEGTGQP